jgi:dTDP-4-amino-4,6-dideoxygalactose transaminase
MISVLIPDVPDAKALAPYLARIDSTRWYSNFGPLNSELESRLAKFLDVPSECVCTVSSCTLGLELAIQDAADIGTALMPSLTFPATATSITRTGGLSIKFCDVYHGSWYADFVGKELHDASVLIPVCAFGLGLDWDYHFKLGRSFGTPVVVDAASAFGNQRIGELSEGGVVAVFSLHATKSLPGGEGGFVVAHARTIERIRAASNFGFTSGRVCDDAHSTNAKLSEFHAAVALASLDAWYETSAKRLRVASWYFKRLPESVTLQVRPETDILVTMPVLLPEGADPDAIAAILDDDGIETRRWYYPPIHKMPAFETEADLPITKDISSRLLGLPFHTHLSEDDVAFVCDKLAEALK